MTTKDKHDLTVDSLDEDQGYEHQQQAECSATTAHSAVVPFPFLPLYSQFSFAQRFKNTMPFSKLFFSNNIKPLASSSSDSINRAIRKNHDVIHDKEQCMFLLELDSKAAICYLPTRTKNVIEVYHTEIPPKHRHKGVGDRLVRECLTWAKESGTFVIPTCTFVRRHLEYNRLQNYHLVIVKNEQEVQSNR
ncbi:hypothetical protein BD408DRAFT_169294 [Parasitella parasitica]|nr:hypothetical protein BD408DRAFT_169294 [Parasitella parasitica]